MLNHHLSLLNFPAKKISYRVMRVSLVDYYNFYLLIFSTIYLVSSDQAFWMLYRLCYWYVALGSIRMTIE